MHYSPLRYPGGKRKLANFIKLVFRANDLLDGEYAEVYAGGSGVALALLYGEYVERVHINDLDRGIYAFWHAAVNDTEALCRTIRDVPLNMDEWERQRSVLFADDPDLLDLGLATFYLNRTNRSGIIVGGVIGGKAQAGKWKLDARFNKSDLIQRIEKIGRYRSRIRLYNLDAALFLEQAVPKLPQKSLIYLDPPYYVKGTQMLYANYYGQDEHADIAKRVADLDRAWIVSYDNVSEIRALYTRFRYFAYEISYTAQEKHEGKEITFFSDGLKVPDVPNPVRVGTRDLRQLSLSLNAYQPLRQTPSTS